MKYNLRKFNTAVQKYKQLLKETKKKSFLINIKQMNKKAFFSIPALSMALHELDNEIFLCMYGKNDDSLKVLKEIWACTDKKKKKALDEFINLFSKLAKQDTSYLFTPPDISLETNSEGFTGNIKLPFLTDWFKEYRQKELAQTCKIIWKDVFAIKKNEKIGCGLPLLRKKKELGLPLEDYLDAYAICWSMIQTIKNQCKDISLGSSTSKSSMLAKSEKISELRATLLGCELEKNIHEPIFKKFKNASSLFKINRLRISDATFFIAAKGYPGKHIFGEKIGYPTKNKKSRWNSPGMMIFKLDFYPQTALEQRPPLSRVGFTETLPIDVFIQTSKINWNKMRQRNHVIQKITQMSEKIIVKGKKSGSYTTDLEIGLMKKNGKQRFVRRADGDARYKINPEYLKETRIKAGMMANIPSGEMFVTPEYTKGTFIGDVVISIDQSYMLSSKDPLIIKATGNKYSILKGPKKILKELSKKKRESWKGILEQEKNKSIPKQIIEIKKDNFNNIGEFAINTNPKAELCNYLIVNEKIANMIHIALGSGFEPDRATDYHTDIVIDAMQQKLDIYGIDKKGNLNWIMKNGKSVV